MIRFKDSVNSLCSVINSLQPFPLETVYFLNFKDVKISKDATEAFWHVLHNLTCGFECQELIDCTKLQFAKRCYKGLNFYSLPNNISSPISNLELTLAFSWLICNGIIEEKVDGAVSKTFNLKYYQKCHEFSTADTVRKNENTTADGLLYNLLKLRSCFCNYTYFSLKKNKLTCQANGKIFGVSSSTATSLIRSSCRNKAQSSVFLEKVSYCKHLVNLYAFWKTQEKNYLQWIESILKENKSKSKRLIYKEMSLNAEKVRVLFQNNIITSVTPTDNERVTKDTYSSGIQASILQQNVENICGILHHLGLAVLKYDIPSANKSFN